MQSCNKLNMIDLTSSQMSSEQDKKVSKMSPDEFYLCQNIYYDINFDWNVFSGLISPYKRVVKNSDNLSNYCVYLKKNILQIMHKSIGQDDICTAFHKLQIRFKKKDAVWLNMMDYIKSRLYLVDLCSHEPEYIWIKEKIKMQILNISLLSLVLEYGEDFLPYSVTTLDKLELYDQIFLFLNCLVDKMKIIKELKRNIQSMESLMEKNETPLAYHPLHKNNLSVDLPDEPITGIELANLKIEVDKKITNTVENIIHIVKFKYDDYEKYYPELHQYFLTL